MSFVEETEVFEDEEQACAAKEDISWRDIRYQILSSNIAFLFTINCGVNLAFSNLLLEDVDQHTSSWFASIAALSTPIGAVACGPLMDMIGRKGTNMIIAIPCITTWLIFSFSKQDQIQLLYFGRFLSGIAAGLSTANLVYVSETTHKKYRSLFLSLLGIHFSFGILLTTILKLFMTWRESAVFFVIFFSIVALLVLFLTPESPVWLANFRSDFEGAEKSLKKLISNASLREEEWRNLKKNARHKSSPINLKKFRWHQPAVYRPVIALLILIFLQQLSGLYPMIFYAYNIFPQVSPRIGNNLKKEAFVMFGIVRFVASVVSCSLSVKIGRRKLLMYSSTGMFAITILLIVCRLTRNENAVDFVEDVKEWIALLSFIMFVGIGAIGVMTIPWTLIVELLPTEKRGTGGAYLISYAYINLFVFTKTFPFIMDFLGVTVLFIFFAFISLILTLFIYLYIPETLGRTLHEIESFYGNKKTREHLTA